MKSGNGDIYRRVKTGPNTFACGCRWERWAPPGRYGITGDVLIECEFHRRVTAARVKRSER